MRAVLAALCCLLSLATAAQAVPLCMPGTLTDYLALPTGCTARGVTLSEFTFNPSPFGTPPTNAGDVHINLAPGPTAGSPRLLFTFNFGQSIEAAGITFTAAAPVLHTFTVAFTSPLEFPPTASATLNGVQVVNAQAPIQPPDIFPSRTVSFPPVASKDFDLELFSEAPIASPQVAVDLVTPEPATFLLWGTAATGLGFGRWRRHQKHRDQA